MHLFIIFYSTTPVTQLELSGMLQVAIIYWVYIYVYILGRDSGRVVGVWHIEELHVVFIYRLYYQYRNDNKHNLNFYNSQIPFHL